MQAASPRGPHLAPVGRQPGWRVGEAGRGANTGRLGHRMVSERPAGEAGGALRARSKRSPAKSREVSGVAHGDPAALEDLKQGCEQGMESCVGGRPLEAARQCSEPEEWGGALPGGGVPSPQRRGTDRNQLTGDKTHVLFLTLVQLSAKETAAI